jgi:hypothetical protein
MQQTLWGPFALFPPALTLCNAHFFYRMFFQKIVRTCNEIHEDKWVSSIYNPINVFERSKTFFFSTFSFVAQEAHRLVHSLSDGSEFTLHHNHSSFGSFFFFYIFFFLIFLLFFLPVCQSFFSFHFANIRPRLQSKLIISTLKV